MISQLLQGKFVTQNTFFSSHRCLVFLVFIETKIVW